MNYITQLNAAMDKIAEDERLNPSHVSLYVALFQLWNLKRFENPIQIFRDEAMCLSKIGSKSTYHKCLHNLNDWGYIKYLPSKNPHFGSRVQMLVFTSTDSGHLKELSVLKSGHLKEPSVPNSGHVNELSVPKSGHLNEPLYINNTNIKHNKQVNGKKKFLPPSLDEISIFFKEYFPLSGEMSERQRGLEGVKFSNYYTANGWKIGGKAPMKDWKAAARNWMLKAKEIADKQKPNAVRPQSGKFEKNNLHTFQNKNYDEPL